MDKKLLVIGSNSFSGSHFINTALEYGYEVIGVSRSPEPHPVFLPYKKTKTPPFRFHQLDLNNDIGEIMSLVQEFRPFSIVNFAAQSMVAESWDHPEHWFQTNVVANVILHNNLRKCDFLEKYVHISTPEVYGSCEGFVSENTDYNPSTPYAVSRAAADMSLMSFFKAYGFPVVFTRAANVYGQGQQLYRIVPRAVLYFLTGKRLQLHGGGQSVRSFIHIRDVAEGILAILLKGAPGEIFHVSTSRNISIRSLVELISHRMRISFDEHVDIVDDRLRKDRAYLLESNKIRNLGWADSRSLESGIDEVIDWVQNNLETLTQQPQTYIHKQ